MKAKDHLTLLVLLIPFVGSCGTGLSNYSLSPSPSVSPSASSHSFVADFSTLSQWDTSAGDTGLWNTVDQRIQAAVSANGIEIGFGNGSDGAFSDGPAQTGITVSGSIVSINTDTKASFNFSSFNLSHGKTLVATGSHPLILLVLGSATVAGTVDLSGGSSASGTNNSAGGPAPGGTGVASGGTGGAAGFGVNPGDTHSTAGKPTAGSIALGGALGANTFASGSDAGGGGGCNGVHGAAPDAAGNDAQGAPGGGVAGACATTRASIAAAFESAFIGGAGGGGGGGFTAGGSNVSGAGGGAGGGALHLVALGAISFGITPHTGQVLANGSSGGSNNVDNGSDCGGSGGGGSGGSIWLQTKSTIADASNLGTLNVSGGSGGVTDATCTPTGDGGNGSLGIVRLDSTSAQVTGSTVLLTHSPAIRSGQSYVVTSKAIDTGITSPSFSTPMETHDTTSSGCGTSGTLSVVYEGSANGTTFGTGVPAAQISILNGNRYVRFQVTITTTGSTPPCLDALSFAYVSQ